MQKCNLCGSGKFTKMFKVYRDVQFEVVRCQNCGLVFQHPMPEIKKIDQMYDEDYFKGKGFDQTVNYVKETKRNSKRILFTQRIKNIERVLGRKGKILDIGCAFGEFLQCAKERGWECSGIELSSYPAKYAKEHGLSIFNGTLEDAKYKDDEFDVIVMQDVIEHLPDPKSTLKECNRILRKGGLIVIETGNIDSIVAKLRGNKWSYLLSGHLYYFSRKTLRLMLKRCGFRIKKAYYGDEIDLHSRLRNAKRKSSHKDSFGFFNYMLYTVFFHFIRKVGIGDLSLGGMLFIAKK